MRLLNSIDLSNSIRMERRVRIHFIDWRDESKETQEASKSSRPETHFLEKGQKLLPRALYKLIKKVAARRNLYKMERSIVGVGKSTIEQGGNSMDKRTLAKFRKVLLSEKERIINNTKQTIHNELNISQDDLPDEADLAATEINQNLVFKLRDRERQLLSKIDLALARMDEGNFGVCQECEEPIEVKRLEARPVSTLCLSCKERDERREKIYA